MSLFFVIHKLCSWTLLISVGSVTEKVAKAFEFHEFRTEPKFFRPTYTIRQMLYNTYSSVYNLITACKSCHNLNFNFSALNFDLG